MPENGQDRRSHRRFPLNQTQRCTYQELLYRLPILLNACFVLVHCQSLDSHKQVASSLRSHPFENKERYSPESAPRVSSRFVDPGGPLNLHQLTALAIANSAVGTAAEANARVARARYATIGEWRDPELRASFDWDDLRVNEVVEAGGTDDIRRAETLSMNVRFYLPNPWKIRAELYKSLAEIDYADFVVRQEQRNIANKVKRTYQKLQFLKARARIGDIIKELKQEEYERLDGLVRQGLSVRQQADKQRMMALRLRGRKFVSLAGIRKTRQELATLVGLNDPGRIQVTGPPNCPVIGVNALLLPTLTEIAYVQDPEINSVNRKRELARGDLSAFEARKIPWFSFIYIGRDSVYRDNLVTKDTYEIGLAIKVPIFTMFSKEESIYREQIRGFQKQAAQHRRQIERRIAGILMTIRTLQEDLERFDRESDEIGIAYREIRESGDPIARTEFAQQQTVMRLERVLERLVLAEAYHESILDLENIVRMDIEEIFTEQSVRIE